jgi:uncharacterized SAM-binding protein YcdF (DUF218 family)
MKVKRSRLRLVLFFALGGILILATLLNPWALPRAAKWLDVGRPPQKADAVVLLNGSFNTRPFVAAALVHGDWAPKLLLNTVADHPNQANCVIPRSFDINVKVLQYAGLPRDRIVRLDSDAATTYDEAQGVAGYLAEHPAKRLMIVTEGPHTRRARWIFEQVLADQQVEILMVTAPSDEFDNSNWWRTEFGFLFVTSEYFKLFYYGVRYSWLGYQIIVGIALAMAMAIYAWFVRHRKLVVNRAALL